MDLITAMDKVGARGQLLHGLITAEPGVRGQRSGATMMDRELQEETGPFDSCWEVLLFITAAKRTVMDVCEMKYLIYYYFYFFLQKHCLKFLTQENRSAHHQSKISHNNDNIFCSFICTQLV